MELKDFIKNTLLAVVKGVDEANKVVDRFRLTSHKNMGTGERGQKIEFDIAVIVDKASENNAKGGIKVALVNLAGGIKDSESTKDTHKIKFEIFIKDSGQ